MGPTIASLFFAATIILLYQDRGIEWAVVYGMVCIVLMLGGIGTTINKEK